MQAPNRIRHAFVDRLDEGGVNICFARHWEKVTRQAHRRVLAVKAVARKGVSIALAFWAFGVGETCVSYSLKRRLE